MLDLSAAFDLVSPKLLVKKLKVYGLETCFISWIESYLSKRFQCVWIDHIYSTLLANETGVPQGSLLGPLLFLIFFNDLPYYVSQDMDCYADDSNMTSSGTSVVDIGHLMNKDCDQVRIWTLSNKLRLNTEKTKVMLLGTSTKLETTDIPLEVEMAGVKLNQTTETSVMLLGIHIQSNLKWSEQISYLASKLQARLSSLEKLRYVLTRRNQLMSTLPYVLLGDP